MLGDKRGKRAIELFSRNPMALDDKDEMLRKAQEAAMAPPAPCADCFRIA